MDSVEALLDALGGNAVVARKLEICRAATSNWRFYRAIPPQYAIPLKRLAAEKGIEAPDKLFLKVTKVERLAKKAVAAKQ